MATIVYINKHQLQHLFELYLLCYPDFQNKLFSLFSPNSYDYKQTRELHTVTTETEINSLNSSREYEYRMKLLMRRLKFLTAPT